MRQTCGAAAIALLLAFTRAGAQRPAQSPSSSPDQPTPVFRAATHLVQVNVVVHDSHGSPVDDLKKEDFSMTEQGKAQQISFFAMTSADKSATPAVVQQLSSADPAVRKMSAFVMSAIKDPAAS